MAYWPDTGTGVDTQPARKPVQSAIRKYFTEGGIGQAPTVPGGDWFNQMTNEVLNVLAAAGIDPSKTDDDQLLQAIMNVSNAMSALEALRRSYAEVGYTLRRSPESFENGGTLTSANDVLLHKASGKAYSGFGPFPQDVVSGTNPVDDSDYIDCSQSLFRHNSVVYGTVSDIASGKYEVGLRITVIDRAMAVFTINSGGIADGYGVLTAGSGKTAIIVPSKSTTVKSFGIPTDGVTNADAGLASLASLSSVIRFDNDQQELLITTIPTQIKWIQNGTLVFDVGEPTKIVAGIGLQLDGTKLYSTKIKGPLISAAGLVLNNVFQGRRYPTTTDLTRYQACSFESCKNLRAKSLTYFESGPRFLDCEKMQIDGVYADINNIGFGLDGNVNGTDGFKISGKTSGNISNVIIVNPSRDGFDGYTSGKELTINNYQVYDFKFNGFELKYDTSAADDDDTPHDINISNVVFIGGGVGQHGRYAALSIGNSDNPTQPSRAPRRINISNVTARELFANAGISSVNLGYDLIGTEEVSLNNVNLGYIIGPTTSSRLYYGGSISRCANTTLTASPTVGLNRGLNLSDVDGLELHSSDIGYKNGAPDSITGINLSGTNRKVKMFGGKLRGSTNPMIGGLGVALLDSKFHGVDSRGGQIRIDTFDNLGLISCDIECISTDVDAIFSSSDTPASRLEIIGGNIIGGRSGLNVQSMTKLKCMLVNFSGYASALAVRGATDGNSIIAYCTSKDSTGAAAFPTATVNDKINNNI